MKTEQLEKISTLAFNSKYPLKHCWCCKSWKPINEFCMNRSTSDSYNYRCRQCGAEYKHSERGRMSQQRYDHSEKGIACDYRYRATAKRREYMKIWNKQWRATHPTYMMERYYRIQDEAGCHFKVESFYPAYRFIKSLETAEVVEI